MDTIGTLEIEDTALNKAWIFSWLFPILTIVFSVMQYVCFHLYNEKYHPMAMILEESKIKGMFKFAIILPYIGKITFCHNTLHLAVCNTIYDFVSSKQLIESYRKIRNL